jgi:drug/metabolite transporter (DMT)-like permease
MIAILGGLGAATLWAAANLASSRSSRIIGATSTLAWMTLVGLVVTAPFAVASGPLPPITPTLTLWLTFSGVGSVVGLMLVYRALRIGKVGVVLAIASTEGAIAAVFAVIAGEHLSIPTTLVLAVIAVGVAIVALAGGGSAEPAGPADSAHEDGRPGPEPWLSPERRAALLAATGAIAFGFSIYGTARAGISLPIAVAILPARVVGVACVFVPMALAGRLRMTRRAVPMVVIVAMGEVLGNVAYVVGARESIAIASVLASQFAAVGAVAAFLIFRERLSAAQRSGFVAIAIGVAVLAVLRG